MRTLKSPVIFVVMLAAALNAAENVPPGLEDLPAVVAEVNGKQIRRDDLVRELVGASLAQALQRLVERSLIEEAAKAAGVTVTAEEIEQQFKIDRRDLNLELIQLPGQQTPSIEEMIRARFGMTADEYKNVVIRQRLLTKRSLLKDVYPTDEQLLDYFNKNTDQFQPPTEYRASHILITPFDPRDLYRGFRFQGKYNQMAKMKQERQRRINLARNDKIFLNDQDVDADLKREVKQKDPNLQLGAPEINESFPHKKIAEKVLAEIKSGQISWDQAVKKYTQDPLDLPYKDPDSGRMISEREKLKMGPGDVGKFTKDGPLVREFYEAAKDMKPGDIVGPVATYYGFHIIRMLEVTPKPRVTFKDVRDKVERAFIDNEIQLRSENWLKKLTDEARIKIERGQLWPPDPKKPDEMKDDPVVATVNGAPIKRSEIWRELLRSDGQEALNRLIHFQIIMTMLKNMGIDRLEWEGADPARRTQNPPPSKPIVISEEAVDLELNADRVRLDDLNAERMKLNKNASEISLREYIYSRYGQSVEEYKQKLEAGQVVREAIRQKIPIDDKTLLTEFAMARNNYDTPVWYEISHILVIPNGGMENSDQAAHTQARLIVDQIYRLYTANPTAENFGKLVSEFSMDAEPNKLRGGFLGACYPEVRSADLLEAPVIYEEIKRQNLERGQVSGPIKTDRGYHLVRVDNVHPGHRAEFYEVKARVERDYLQERAKMYADIWLRALDSKRVKRYAFQLPSTDSQPLGPRDNFPVPGLNK